MKFLEGNVLKIGISLKQDFNELRKLQDFIPHRALELQKWVKRYGIKEEGLQRIYGIVFQKKISKSKRLSNWETDELSNAQKVYAATDAWSCLKIYYSLRLKKQIPNAMETKKHLSTLCVQEGWKPKKGEPLVLPIYQSTTFKYETSDQMAKLFDLEENGYFYSRLQNPTTDAVAEKIASLEGGVSAVLTSSGQAANFFAVCNICKAGDHIVSSTDIYGGTFNLFSVTLKQMGIDCTFVHITDDEETLSKAFRPNTKVMFGEVLSNPSVQVLDIEKFSKVAHAHGVPLIVDNTFPTPINCRPFEWGADIVTHSTSKYMDGHATVLGGCIVDSGNFLWGNYPEKYAGLCRPDVSYHGLTFTEKFGKKAYTTKIVSTLMRDYGAVQSPHNAFLLNLGLETLHLRVPRHCENAKKVAKFLKEHPKVSWVSYPDLEDSASHDLCKKYLPKGSSGVMSFGLKGGRENSIRFIDSLELVSIATHVADARSMVLHPASHTHRQMTDEQLREAGINPDLIRLSVGIEDSRDIIADIEKALEKA
ncbi:MAG TPA: bifunctional O-acetylhomoserine aminocarboxypropyltransferase/cysteine synthase [Porphyromonadaceae bacterium]|nr:bifunctional O-acetylhomoserine aminocarboxypropyltransferase/cysteine synthase [Porphyromonadaceae bacterium]